MIGSTFLAGATAALLWFNLRSAEPVHNYDTSPAIASEIRTQSGSSSQSPSNTQSQNEKSAPIAADMQAHVGPAPRMAQDLKSTDYSGANGTSTIDDAKDQANRTALPLRIKGLRAVALNNKELSELGITLTPDGLQLYSELGFKSDDPVALNAFSSTALNNSNSVSINQKNIMRLIQPLGYSDSSRSMVFSVKLDTFQVESRLVSPDKEHRATFYPLVVTHRSRDLSGSERSRTLLFGNTQQNASDANRVSDEASSLYDVFVPEADRTSLQTNSRFPILSKLIPVRIMMGDPKSNGAEIILWYFPSDEFLDALPKKFGDLIRQERETIEKAEEKLIADSTYRDGKLSGSNGYMDVGRTQSGALEISSIGPNPARDQARLRFTLGQDRQISVALYDMNGQQVGLLAPQQFYHSGENAVMLDLSSFNSGAYLINLITPQGEQAIQRFIILK